VVGVSRSHSAGGAIRLRPWAQGDLPLLERLVGDPAMMEHLGGPESPEKIADRQRRYERAGTGDRVFAIVDAATGEKMGWVGYWPRAWRGKDVYEMGWSVLPAFQGRGIARQAAALAIERARSDGGRSLAHAFPSVDNAPSNAVCRRLGFTLVEACEFEYPPGHIMRCNDWRLDLAARAS
jgi:RimJ/RimL family protein N-acetyltransferase